jgi:hypothetical protein
VSFDALLAAVARAVGGTQPSAALSTVPAPLQPYWYSGRDAADGTGVSGVVGCFSLPVATIDATPVAMVLPGPWRPDQSMPTYPMQGHKFTEDDIHVRVMVGHDDETAQMARLVNFRDTVPPAFDAHMQLFNTLDVAAAWCNEGDFIEVLWSGNVYFAMQFIVRVQRGSPVSYTG